MNQRKKLTDILSAGIGNLQTLWNSTSAAKEFEPLPAGEYVARILSGELDASRTHSTPGYKLTFQVCEGELSGRKFWLDLWLTPAALPMTKRDLAKLGVSSLDQLEQPLPPGVICKVKLALRVEDDGTSRNRVRAFEVVRIEEPQVDAFAPDDEMELPQ